MRTPTTLPARLLAAAVLSLSLLAPVPAVAASPGPAPQDDPPAPTEPAAPGETPDLAAAGTLDELILEGGSSLQGRVLKETDTRIYLDVGWTVMEVPKDMVVDRVAGTGAVVEQGAGSAERLYTRAEGLAELTLEEAVERYGEGVVVVKQPGSLGSGFVVREDGYIITNAHVVQGEVEVSVTVHRKTADGVEKKVFEEVEIVSVNPFVDLALIKISEEELGDFPLTKVYFGDMDAVEVGEKVFAVGAPLGMERSVSEGIVSIKNRAQDGKVYIQTTAAINGGNSGGPLFNSKGEVIGVNSWHFMFAEGMNFSIPIDFVTHFIANRDAFAFDRDNPNSGYRYLKPPRRKRPDPTRD